MTPYVALEAARMRVELEIWRELVQQKRVRETIERQRTEDHASLVEELQTRLRTREARIRELETASLACPSPEQQQQQQEPVEVENENNKDESVGCEDPEDNSTSIARTPRRMVKGEGKEEIEITIPHSKRTIQRPPKLLLLALSLSLSNSFTGGVTTHLNMDKKEALRFRMLDLRDAFSRPYIITIVLQATVLFARHYGLHKSIFPYHLSMDRFILTGADENIDIAMLRHFIKHVLHRDRALSIRDFMDLLHLYARDNGMTKVLLRVITGDFSEQTAFALAVTLLSRLSDIYLPTPFIQALKERGLIRGKDTRDERNNDPLCSISELRSTPLLDPTATRQLVSLLCRGFGGAVVDWTTHKAVERAQHFVSYRSRQTGEKAAPVTLYQLDDLLTVCLDTREHCFECLGLRARCIISSFLETAESRRPGTGTGSRGSARGGSAGGGLSLVLDSRGEKRRKSDRKDSERERSVPLNMLNLVLFIHTMCRPSKTVDRKVPEAYCLLRQCFGSLTAVHFKPSLGVAMLITLRLSDSLRLSPGITPLLDSTQLLCSLGETLGCNIPKGDELVRRVRRLKEGEERDVLLDLLKGVECISAKLAETYTLPFTKESFQNIVKRLLSIVLDWSDIHGTGFYKRVDSLVQTSFYDSKPREGLETKKSGFVLEDTGESVTWRDEEDNNSVISGDADGNVQ